MSEQQYTTRILYSSPPEASSLDAWVRGVEARRNGNEVLQKRRSGPGLSAFVLAMAAARLMMLMCYWLKLKRYLENEMTDVELRRLKLGEKE